MGKLETKNKKKYKNYVEKREKPPIEIFPQLKEANKCDHLLCDLVGQLEKEKKEKKPFTSWISTKAFSLMKQKAKALRNNQSEDVQKLGKALWNTLGKDRAKI